MSPDGNIIDVVFTISRQRQLIKATQLRSTCMDQSFVTTVVWNEFRVLPRRTLSRLVYVSLGVNIGACEVLLNVKCASSSSFASSS